MFRLLFGALLLESLPRALTSRDARTSGHRGHLGGRLVIEPLEDRCLLSGGRVDFTAPTNFSRPDGITAGPGNYLWFTEYYGNKIGRVRTDGTFPSPAEFPMPEGGFPTVITAGPDGNLWFTDFTANRIWRVTPEGLFTQFPTMGQGGNGITVGPDGNIWEFTVPTTRSAPTSITAAPDGNLWFTEQISSKIARITPDGMITEFRTPTDTTELGAISVGPDSNIWFNEELANKIAKLYLLTASGLDLGEAVTAGQPLDAVVANFHDDELGMVGGNYQVDIDWGDGTSGGRAWTTGGGHWVATGSHTYAEPGHYDITVTITDTHAPTGMTATAYSSVEVDPAANSGNSGRRAGFAAFADLASAFPPAPRPAPPLAGTSPAAGVSRLSTRPVDDAAAHPLPLPESSGLAVAVATLRHDAGTTAWAEPPAWLDAAALDLLTRNLLA